MQGNKAQIIQLPIFPWVSWCLGIQSASGLESNPTLGSDLNFFVWSKGLDQKMAKEDPLQPLLFYIFWRQVRKSIPEELRFLFLGVVSPVRTHQGTPWDTHPENAKEWAFIDIPAPHGPFLTLPDPKGRAGVQFPPFSARPHQLSPWQGQQDALSHVWQLSEEAVRGETSSESLKDTPTGTEGKGNV